MGETALMRRGGAAPSLGGYSSDGDYGAPRDSARGRAGGVFSGSVPAGGVYQGQQFSANVKHECKAEYKIGTVNINLGGKQHVGDSKSGQGHSHGHSHAGHSKSKSSHSHAGGSHVGGYERGGGYSRGGGYEKIAYPDHGSKKSSGSMFSRSRPAGGSYALAGYSNRGGDSMYANPAESRAMMSGALPDRSRSHSRNGFDDRGAGYSARMSVGRPASRAPSKAPSTTPSKHGHVRGYERGYAFSRHFSGTADSKGGLKGMLSRKGGVSNLRSGGAPPALDYAPSQDRSNGGSRFGFSRSGSRAASEGGSGRRGYSANMGMGVFGGRSRSRSRGSEAGGRSGKGFVYPPCALSAAPPAESGYKPHASSRSSSRRSSRSRGLEGFASSYYEPRRSDSRHSSRSRTPSQYTHATHGGSSRSRSSSRSTVRGGVSGFQPTMVAPQDSHRSGSRGSSRRSSRGGGNYGFAPHEYRGRSGARPPPLSRAMDRMNHGAQYANAPRR